MCAMKPTMRTRFPAAESRVGESAGGLLSATKMSENASVRSERAGTACGCTVVVARRTSGEGDALAQDTSNRLAKHGIRFLMRTVLIRFG